MKDTGPKKVSCYLNGGLLELDQLDVVAVKADDADLGKQSVDDLKQRQTISSEPEADELTQEERLYFASHGIQFIPTSASRRDLSPELRTNNQPRRVFRYKGNIVLETRTIFVKIKPEASLKNIIEYLGSIGLEYKYALTFSPQTFVFHTKEGIDPYELSRILFEDPRLEFAEPDFESMPRRRWKPSAIQYYSNLWHLNNDGSQQNNVNPHAGLGFPAKIGADIHIEEAWEQLISGGTVHAGQGIRLAIMEYGFDKNHPDLSATILEPDLAVRVENNKGYFNTSNISKDVDPLFPILDHGTAVAGAALAKNVSGKIIGPAPECTFIPIQIGSITTESYCNGIIYAANPGLLSTNSSDYFRGADILSISIGPPDGASEKLLKEALLYATTYGRQGRGLVIAYALRNEFVPSEYDDFIAAQAEVIAVGRTSQDDRYSGSSFGFVDLVAPGTHIFTTNHLAALASEVPYSGEVSGMVNNGNGPVLATLPGYLWNISGTSFSTPILAGVVALLLQKQVKLSWREVKAILQKSADMPDLGFDGTIIYKDGNIVGNPVITEDLSWTTQPNGGSKLLDNQQNVVLNTPNSKLQTMAAAGADEPGIATGIPHPLSHGTKFLYLNNQADNFIVGQAIVIGFQTFLQAVPAFTSPNPPTELIVDSVDGFQPGDTIQIGKGPVTYVSGDTIKDTSIAAPLPKNEIEIWNPCGFKTGQFIRLKGGYVYNLAGPYTSQTDEVFKITEIKTSGNRAVFKLNTDRTREFGYGDLVELAYTAEAVITAINTSTKTLTITTSTPADYFSHFDVNTRVELLHTEVRQVLEVFPGDVHYLRIDSLLHNHPVGRPVHGGLIPKFSPAYGYGRLNAGRAISFALDNQNHTDLMIRDILSDDGFSPLPTNTVIDSPDIWVRNRTGADPGAVPPAYSVAGPHENPSDSENRKVYIRVRNRNATDNFEARIKVFLALSDSNTIQTYDFPYTIGNEQMSWIGPVDGINPSKALRNGDNGVHLIGEIIVPAGDIPGNSDSIYSVDWPKQDIPPDLDIHTHLLVMITPFDGDKAGIKVAENNNLSYKKVQIVQRIRFKKDLGTLENLEKSIEMSNFSPPSSLPFFILIDDNTQTFFPKNIRINIQRKIKHTNTEQLEFHYDGSNWAFKTDQPDWIQLNAAAIAPQLPGNQFSFSGSFDTSLEQRRMKITVIVGDNSGGTLFENNHLIRFRSEAGEDSKIESKGGRFHFFTNTDNLINSRAYGPLSDIEYRLSSMHSNSGTAKALAICDGIVCVQRNILGNLNLILKPTQQPPFNFPTIRYIIYHNLKANSLLNAGKVADAPTNRLTETVWASQQQVNLSRHNKEVRMGLPPSPDEDAGEQALGYRLWYDISNPQVPLERYKDEEPIDNLFFRPADDIQLPSVKGGWDIGEFVAGDFGLTIILVSGHYQPSLEIARGMDNVLHLAAAGSGNAAAELENRWARETVLHYMDPCAFFGAFYPFRLFVKDSAAGSLFETTNFDKKREDQLYADCLALFQNKNKVYLSILNEYRFSFNFFQNYRDTLRIPAGNSYADLDYYGTQNWPVLILGPSNFTEKDPGAKIVFQFQLPLKSAPNGTSMENPMPLLYLAQGYWDRLLFPFRDLRGKKKFLLPGSDTVTGYTQNRIELAIPNYGANNQCEPIASSVRLLVLKQADTTPVASAGIVLRGQNPLDHLFCPLNMLRLAEQMPTAPQRSVILEEEVYIDARQSPDLQMDFIGKTGFALAGQHAAFFTYAYDVREKSRKSRSFGMVGSRSSTDSVLTEISNRHDNIEVYKSNLLINGNPKPYVVLNDASTNFSGFEKVDPKELLPIIISYTELQTIKSMIENPANFSPLFPVFIGVQKVAGSSYVHYLDDNNEEYTLFELVLRGYRLNGSLYEINELTTSILIFSYGTF